MSHRLVVDAGKTNTRVALYRDDVRVAESRGSGIPHIGEHDGLRRIVATIVELADGLALPAAGLDAVAAGLTSVFPPSEPSRRLAQALGEALPTTTVVVASDAVTAFLGAVGVRPGVVVSSGTGAVTTGIDADGRYVRVDGWGAMLGDAGSGYAVGRSGVDLALRDLDGRGGSARLRAAIEASAGPVSSLPYRTMNSDNPVRFVAGFAPLVAEAARDGDEAARGIWRRAVEDLVAAAEAAARRVAPTGGPFALSYTGSLFDVDDLVRTPFLEAVASRLPQAAVAPPVDDALHGALLLALHPREPMVLGTTDRWDANTATAQGRTPTEARKPRA